MALRRCSKDSAASLRFGFPRGAEALPLHRGVAAEFYDHEVRRRDEKFIAEILLARKGRQIYGLLLGSTAYEDLHYVETLLGLEFLELKHTNRDSFCIIPI